MPIRRAVDRGRSPLILKLEAKAHSLRVLQEYLTDAADRIERIEESRLLPIKGLHVGIGSHWEYSIDVEGRTTFKEVAKAIALLVLMFFAILGFVKVFPPG
jgi:hypothetical protein